AAALTGILVDGHDGTSSGRREIGGVGRELLAQRARQSQSFDGAEDQLLRSAVLASHGQGEPRQIPSTRQLVPDEPLQLLAQRLVEALLDPQVRQVLVTAEQIQPLREVTGAE